MRGSPWWEKFRPPPPGRLPIRCDTSPCIDTDFNRAGRAGASPEPRDNNMSLVLVRRLLVVGALAMGEVCIAQPATLPDFTDLVERAAPAVVNIRTTARLSQSRTQQLPDLDENDPGWEFFRRFFPQPGPQPNPHQGPMPRSPRPDREIPRGQGSGFVISSDGYVMTNHHVVEGADEIVVTLPDKREFKGRVIGSDQRSDVALVKIEASGLPSSKIGDPARLKV